MAGRPVRRMSHIGLRRWHHGYSHSDFLTDKFCKKFWVPFLQGDKPKPADKPAQMPLLVRVVCILRLRWVMVTFVGMVVFWSLQIVDYKAGGFSMTLGYPFGKLKLASRNAEVAPPSGTSEQPSDHPRSKPSQPSVEPEQPRQQPPPSQSVERDPLKVFDGIWVSTNPPGQRVMFTSTGFGDREVSLPQLGQAVIRVSDGQSGSNIRLAGPGFDCYYYVSQISARKLVWEFKAGSAICPQLNVLDKVPP
jgi:hypothetical protein